MKKIIKVLAILVIFAFFALVFGFYYYNRNCNVVIKIGGGLANQIMHYYVGSIISKDTNMKVCYDNNFYKQKGLQRHAIYVLDKYGVDLNIVNDNGYFLKTAKVSLNCNDVFGKNYKKLSNRTMIKQVCFDEKIYSKYRQDLIKDLTLKIPLNKKNVLLLQEIKKKKNSVSIHVRKGDFVNVKNSKFYYDLDVDYYNKAAKIFENMDDVHFFVFSNDINWAKKNLKLNKPMTFVDVNDETEGYFDLELMRNCKHNIIANSTFSFIAAFLNDNKNKVVVAPKKWYKTEKFSFTLKDWILIENNN